MKHVRHILEDLIAAVPGHRFVVTRHEGENDGTNWLAASASPMTDGEREMFARRVGALRKSDPQIEFD